MTEAPADAPPRRGMPWGRISLALVALIAGTYLGYDALPRGHDHLIGAALLTALAALPATAALAAARRRGRWWGVATALGGYAVLGAIAMPNYAPHDHGRNPYARACGNTLRMAVEQYATDNEGRYPTNAGVIAAVAAPGKGYLPGDALPTLWSARPQAVAIAPPPPLVGAAAIAAGAKPSPLETDLGPGRIAEEGPVDARCWGAMLYDHDPKTETYVIYAVGKRAAGKRAVVVFATTNAR